ncbi:MAG: hypothetical protein F9K22_09315 [Bacteroidetes bacterium]|nr:MAG: hypothetical protein F9K22_09315 [Bacteroidota bacterium]
MKTGLSAARSVLRRALMVLALAASAVPAQERPRYYFFRPENTFGSDAQFGPVSLFLNGAYDMLRNGGHHKKFLAWNYSGDGAHVWRNLRAPIANIRAFGVREFFDQEIFNFTIGRRHAEFLPNIADHAIGNGMEYAKLAEYFDHHGVPLPYLWSGLTTTSYQVVNEIIEADGYRGVNVDLIADIYLFNTAGIVLFSTEWGKRFFSETVPVYNWPGQPVIEPATGFLQNAGQQYFVRRRFDALGRWSPIFYWGVYVLPGVSYDLDGENTLTVGVGRVVNKLKDGRLRGFRKIDPQLDGAAGFFWDRNNSLLLSVLGTGPGLYNVQVNLYPGVADLWGFSPGVYVAYGEWDKFILGVTVSALPAGLGFGKR